jgi:hypothetical protein
MGVFSFFRVSEEWLMSKTAYLLFATATVVILAVSLAVALLGIPAEDEVTPIARAIWGTGGVFGALSAFFLWDGMWHYWKVCDSSSRIMRRVWFLFLLLGVWYGAILYFLAIYSPSVTKSGNLGRKAPR